MADLAPTPQLVDEDGGGGMISTVMALALGAVLGRYSAVQMAAWPKVKAVSGVAIIMLALWVWRP